MREPVSTLPRYLAGPIAAADGLRHGWFRALGPAGRLLIRNRELRVATIFSLVIATALIGTLVAPFWLLLLGPVVWGVPHLVADIRYLVIRTGYHRRRFMALLGGATLVWMGLGGPLGWGLVCVAGVVLMARAGLAKRLFVAALLVASAYGFEALGHAGNLLFAHLHNFMPLVLWWYWRARVKKLHWIPMGLLVAATWFLLSEPSVELAHQLGGLSWFHEGMGPTVQQWRLATGIDSTWGMRLVLLFCFSQTIHYALWLQILPDEDRSRATPSTFRASVANLRTDLGDAGLAVAILLSLGVAMWAVGDILAAHKGYFRMAHFHAHLEIMALALLAIEGRRTRSTLPT
ncbi:MAG: hypothetical protein ACPG4T_09330 [Nannocystaceae bacterium]